MSVIDQITAAADAARDLDLLARAYSPEEAAERLSVSDQTVRRLCRSGELRHRKVGRRYVIPHVALVEFLGDVDLPAVTVPERRGAVPTTTTPGVPAGPVPDGVHVVVPPSGVGAPIAEEQSPGAASPGLR